MYTLYRSPAAFYGCLITIVITLLSATATPKKFLYYPLYIDIIASSTPQMKIKAVVSELLDSTYRASPKNVGAYLEISLLDCLTKKKFQDFSKISAKSQNFPGLFSNSRTFQDWWEPWNRSLKLCQELLASQSAVIIYSSYCSKSIIFQLVAM